MRRNAAFMDWQNDPKLSDGGGWRAGCAGEGGGAASVTAGAVRCSAWLGVAVIWELIVWCVPNRELTGACIEEKYHRYCRKRQDKQARAAESNKEHVAKRNAGVQ